jgi:hypothetical protein
MAYIHIQNKVLIAYIYERSMGLVHNTVLGIDNVYMLPGHFIADRYTAKEAVRTYLANYDAINWYKFILVTRKIHR